MRLAKKIDFKNQSKRNGMENLSEQEMKWLEKDERKFLRCDEIPLRKIWIKGRWRSSSDGYEIENKTDQEKRTEWKNPAQVDKNQ